MRATDSNLHICLVFISCYLVLFVNGGLLFSIGAIFMDVMSTFNTSRAETAVIHSTAMAVCMGTGLIAGGIIHKYGVVVSGILGGSLVSIGIMACFFATSTVHMTISFGIVYGFGMTCSHISSATSVGQHFHGRRKLLMLSLQSTAVAVGGMVFPYALVYWSDVYGFRGALLIVGGLSMNCIPGCLLWKQATAGRLDNNGIILERKRHLISSSELDDEIEHEEIAKSKENDDDSKTEVKFLKQEDFVIEDALEDTKQTLTVLQSVKAIMTNIQFMIYVIGTIAACPTIIVIIIFVADVFQDKGLTLSDATFGLLLMNIINTFSRLLPGAIMQSNRVPALFCPLLTSVVSTLVLIGLSLSRSRGFTVGVLALVGLPMGMIVTMFSVISAKLVGERNIPTAMGFLFSVNGIGSAITGPVSGYIRDLSGSYTTAFYSVAGMTTFSSILFLVALVAFKLTQKKTGNEQLN